MKIFLKVMQWSCLAMLCAPIIVHAQSEGELIDSLKSTYPTADVLSQIRLINDLAYEYKFSNPDSSMRYARISLSKSMALADDHLISEGYNSVANAFQVQGQGDSAIHYNKRSLDIKVSLRDSLGMADSYNNLGIIYDERGAYAEAVKCYQRALDIYEYQNADPFKTAGTINNLGIVYKNQGENESAISYYERSLKIYEQIESEFGAMATKGNIAALFLKTKEYQKAIDYSKDALAGFQKLGYRRYEPYAYHNMGIAQYHIGQVVEAKKNFLSAIEVYEETKNISELSSVHVDLAELYNNQSRWNDAISSAKKALSYAQSSESKEYEVKAYQKLGFAHLGEGNNSRSAQFFKQYDAGKDELFEKEKTKTIFQLQTQYETVKKEQQIALQELEIRNQTNANRFQRGLFGTLLVGIMLVGFAYYKRFQYRKKLEIQALQFQAEQDEFNAIFHGQELERKRLARDLHDGLGQLLSTARMNVSVLGDAELDKEDEDILNNSIQLIDKSIVEIRNVSHDLMPSVLSKKGLMPALLDIQKRINDSGKFNLRINSTVDKVEISEKSSIQVYRIVQELLNNSIKHSGGNQLVVDIMQDNQSYQFNISDNGKGVSEAMLKNGRGIGWSNMKARSKMMKGSLQILETNATGTQFKLSIPIGI